MGNESFGKFVQWYISEIAIRERLPNVALDGRPRRCCLSECAYASGKEWDKCCAFQKATTGNVGVHDFCLGVGKYVLSLFLG